MDFERANQTLLRVASKYQHITFQDIVVPVPYFINTAEQIYKQAMREAGIQDEYISKVIQLIKEGKTPLGSGGGKGSPEDITQDLGRLITYLQGQGYNPKKPVYVRRWMTEMHVGLDCSGYVYNILESIEKDQSLEILKNMAWANKEERKRSHAGAFIYDSDSLEKVNNYSSLKPLDIIVTKNHIHVGILAENEGTLSLTDCSVGNNGITFNKVLQQGKMIRIDGSEYWTALFASNDLIIRRLHQ